LLIKCLRCTKTMIYYYSRQLLCANYLIIGANVSANFIWRKPCANYLKLLKIT
jgi:hypothetical protein